MDDNDSGEDVLQQHRKRNRGPRPPGVGHLKASADLQTTRHGSNHDDGSNGSDDGSKDDSSRDSDTEPYPVRKRAKRHSKTSRPAVGTPTQLQFYPSQWTDVLESAKRKYRLVIATEIGFPHPKKDLNRASDCLTEAMAAHEDGGGMVEPSKCLINSLRSHCRLTYRYRLL